jgi:hypothetical protein
VKRRVSGVPIVVPTSSAPAPCQTAVEPPCTGSSERSAQTVGAAQQFDADKGPLAGYQTKRVRLEDGDAQRAAVPR